MKKIIVLLFLCLFLNGLIIAGNNVIQPEIKDSFKVAEDSVIYITDNANFSYYASSGYGNSTDPYIISGIFFTAGEASIHIENTDAYCIIQSSVINGSGYYGIYLKNVSNLNITSTQFVEKKAAVLVDNCSRIAIDNIEVINDQSYNDYGVRIDNSDNIIISNSIFRVAEDGIQLWSSSRVAILDNEFINSGISLYNTKYVGTSIVITGNTVNDKPIGYLYNKHDMSINASLYGQLIGVQCTNIVVYDADVSHTNIGVQAIFSQGITVAQSVFSYNRIGVLIYESFYSNINNNDFMYNQHGLIGYFAVGSLVHENNFINNTGYGMWAWYGCSSYGVYLNNFINNGLGNARDDGGREDSHLTWVAARFSNSVSGMTLENVTVTIERAGFTYIAHSNEDGLLKLPVPVFGTYDVTIEKFRYNTISTSIDIEETGIHYFDVSMTKRDLGPGTGYIQARLMDGETPIEGAVVSVYSELDGAYYFLANYTTVTGGQYAGWANITGLYYDHYIFIATHPDYETMTFDNVIINDGLVGTYSIQMEKILTESLIYGGVFDFTNFNNITGANVTVYNAYNTFTSITDIEGVFIFRLPIGYYDMQISYDGYTTESTSLNVTEVGEYSGNPIIIYLTPENYTPESAPSSIINNYDNEQNGNYWDDVGAGFALASGGGYLIPGENLESPEDEYPLASMFINRELPIIEFSNPTTTATDMPTTYVGSDDILFYSSIIIGVVLVAVVLIWFRKQK